MSDLASLNAAVGTDLEQLYRFTIETIAILREPLWKGDMDCEVESAVNFTLRTMSELDGLLTDAGFPSGMTAGEFDLRCKKIWDVPLIGISQEQQMRVLLIEGLKNIRLFFDSLHSGLKLTAYNPSPVVDDASLKGLIKSTEELRTLVMNTTGCVWIEVT